MHKLFIQRHIWFLSFILLFITGANAQTNSFTYQGKLTDSTAAQPTNGTYQMQFALFDAPSAGTQIGAQVTNPAVSVLNGVFTVSLDYGAGSFVGAERFLEIRVFSPATSLYVTLSPRQQVLSSPYAVRTISATAADGLSPLCVLCIDDAKISTLSGAKVTGPVANATAAATSILATTANALSTQCIGCVDDPKISSVSGAKVTGTVANATTSATSAAAATAHALSTQCVGCVDDPKIGNVSGTKVTGTVANAATANALSAQCVGCIDDPKINTVSGAKITGTVANAAIAATSGSAAIADALSTQCLACVDNQKINTVNGNKVNGPVTSAATAGNVTGIVAVLNGGTGTAVKSFVDLTTNQTVNGTKTFNGTQTFNGTLNGTAVDNLVKISTFEDVVPSIPSLAANYVFAAKVVMTVGAGTRVTGVGTAILGRLVASSQTVEIGLCWQPAGGGVIQPFPATGGFLTTNIGTTKQSYSATASVVFLGAGNYNVGFCVRNTSNTAINFNDYSIGWFMVTPN